MKMDMLSSDRRPLRLGLLSRGRPFYGQYDYVLCVKMPEVSALRHKSHQAIDQQLDRRQAWRGQLGSRNFGGSWRGHEREITSEIRHHCHALLDVVESAAHKAWFSQDWAYVYSNDIGYLRRIELLPYVWPHELRQAGVGQQRDSVLVRSSTHTYRNYFRACKPTEPESLALRHLLRQQQDIRLSPKLQHWVADVQEKYLLENFFIDHDGHGIELLLSLVSDRPIRKTLGIKQHK